MAVSDHFSEEDRKKILRAIAEAENQTSGEIRLFVENKCDDSVLDRAAFVFGQLEMQKTKDRNGVLFYVAFDSRQFAILGDAPAMEATLITHGPEGFVRRSLFETAVPALAKAPQPERFVF